MSEEEYLEYERQKALNLAFLDEYEESGDENETAKLQSGMNMFHKKSHERNLIEKQNSETRLAANFGYKTSAIQNQQRTVILEIYEPILIPKPKEMFEDPLNFKDSRKKFQSVK